MIPTISKLLERYFNLPHDRGLIYLNRVAVSLAATLFVLVATAIVAFEDVFPGQTGVESLVVGNQVAYDVLAPKTLQYESPVLTAQRREEARHADPAPGRAACHLRRRHYN